MSLLNLVMRFTNRTQVRPQVEEGNCGKIVAIDIETGAFEVADTRWWQLIGLTSGNPMLSLG